MARFRELEQIKVPVVHMLQENCINAGKIQTRFFIGIYMMRLGKFAKKIVPFSRVSTLRDHIRNQNVCFFFIVFMKSL